MPFKNKLQLAVLFGIFTAIATIMVQMISDTLGRKLGLTSSSTPYLLNVFFLQFLIIVGYSKFDSLHPVQTRMRKFFSMVSLILLVVSITILTMGYGTLLIGTKWKVFLGTLPVGVYVANQLYHVYIFNHKHSNQ